MGDIEGVRPDGYVLDGDVDRHRDGGEAYATMHRRNGRRTSGV